MHIATHMGINHHDGIFRWAQPQQMVLQAWLSGALCHMFPLRGAVSVKDSHCPRLSAALCSYAFDYAPPIVTKSNRSAEMRSEYEQTKFSQSTPGGLGLGLVGSARTVTQLR